MRTAKAIKPRVRPSQLPNRLLAAVVLVAVAWLVFQAVSIGDPRVVDDSGLIAESQFRFNIPQGPASGDLSGVIASPPGWDLSIAWLTRTCQTAPVVRVDRGDAAGLNFNIAVGDMPPNCNDEGAFHALDVRTRQPVDPSDVQVDVRETP